jgi:hypothetical protein
MKNIIVLFFVFFTLTIFLPNMSYSISKANKSEIAALDKKIAELEEMKKGYEAAAIKHANQAERLQFIEGQLQVAKKHWKLADENKKIAAKIQGQIDELKMRKAKLQK